MPLDAQRLRYDTLRSLAFGSITTSYVAVGSAFTHPVRVLNVDNLTDANLLVSFDGTTNHTVIPSGSGKIFDYATNRVGPVDQLEQSVGTVIYVKRESGAPTGGNVYVTVLYASTN